MPLLVFLIVGGVLVLFLLGAFFIIDGWRGEDSLGPPHCARCRYPLGAVLSIRRPRGTPARCPECGDVLSRRDALACERRRREWGSVAVGILLAGPTGSLLALWIWHVVAGTL